MLLRRAAVLFMLAGVLALVIIRTGEVQLVTVALIARARRGAAPRRAAAGLAFAA